MFKEFREFIIKGNVLDLAVGIILGVAFGAIVKSLVDDIIMPPVGLALGGLDFKDLYFTLKQGTPAGPYPSLDGAQEAGAVTVNYGAFINNVINFLIVGFAIFLVVRTANRLRRQPAPPTPDTRPCPYCKSTIAITATRCPQCTSELAAA